MASGWMGMDRFTLAGQENKMSYHDDFYIKDNIIGYTGDILHNPTVYFKKVDGNG